jgi:hypothetical protein
MSGKNMILSDESGSSRRKQQRSCLKCRQGICVEGCRNPYFGQDSRFSGPDSDLGPPKYKVSVLINAETFV